MLLETVCLLRLPWSLRCVQVSFHKPCSIILQFLSRPYRKTVIHIHQIYVIISTLTNWRYITTVQPTYIPLLQFTSYIPFQVRAWGKTRYNTQPSPVRKIQLPTNIFAGAQANKTRHGLSQCIVASLPRKTKVSWSHGAIERRTLSEKMKNAESASWISSFFDQHP